VKKVWGACYLSKNTVIFTYCLPACHSAVNLSENSWKGKAVIILTYTVMKLENIYRAQLLQHIHSPLFNYPKNRERKKERDRQDIKHVRFTSEEFVQNTFHSYKYSAIYVHN
jgi:hypothetical protein